MEVRKNNSPLNYLQGYFCMNITLIGVFFGSKFLGTNVGILSFAPGRKMIKIINGGATSGLLFGLLCGQIYDNHIVSS